ncbi:MAG: hypothetical protein AB1637_09230 [Elusimicrobiota bacterium]
MTKKNKKIFSILNAAAESAMDAVEEHKRYKVPLIIYENGKIKKIDPQKVNIKKRSK